MEHSTELNQLLWMDIKLVEVALQQRRELSALGLVMFELIATLNIPEAQREKWLSRIEMAIKGEDVIPRRKESIP